MSPHSLFVNGGSVWTTRKPPAYTPGHMWPSTWKPPISRQKYFCCFRKISHYCIHPHIPANFGDFWVISYFVLGLWVYTIVETAIFTRCDNFPYTHPYTIRVAPGRETAVFHSFFSDSGNGWSEYLATDVGKCTAWLSVSENNLFCSLRPVGWSNRLLLVHVRAKAAVTVVDS